MLPPAAFSIARHSLPVIALLGLAFVSPARASGSVANDLAAEVHKIFDDHKDAIVKVRATDPLGIRFGSGFFSDPTGTIFTHAAIVSGAQDVMVMYAGRELPARVLIVDRRSGIAILKVDATTPFIPPGNSDEVGIATPIVTLGYPEDRVACPGFGFVVGIDRQYLGQYFSTSHFRANLPVQRGQGGSPILNMKGESIGVLVGRLEDGAACHILPMRAAEKVRRDLVRFGEIRPGWVGVEVEDSEDSVAGSTARIGALDPATPASQSGLLPGDVLLQVGETKIHTSEDVLDASYFLTAGDQVGIEVQRHGEKMTLSVKPTLHPMAPCPDLQTTSAPDAAKSLNLE